MTKKGPGTATVMPVHWQDPGKSLRSWKKSEKFLRMTSPYYGRTFTRRGFSLLEILVVVVVVAIMAAFSFQLTGRMIDRSKRVGCANTMRQAAVALIRYALEHNGTLPGPRYSLRQPQAWGPGWTEDESGNRLGPAETGDSLGALALEPDYFPDFQFLRCPAGRRGSQNNGPLGTNSSPGSSPGRINSDYVYFAHFSRNHYPFSPTSIYEFEHNSRIPLIADVLRVPSSHVMGQRPKPFVSGSGENWGNHVTGSNIGFLDGHVEWKPWEKLNFLNSYAWSGGSHLLTYTPEEYP